jgi:hypothetical protein
VKKLPKDQAIIALNTAVRSSNTYRTKEIIATWPELLMYADEKGQTPLHWAAEAQSLSSVACLIDLGASTVTKDRLGFTAEMVSDWRGEFRMGAYTDSCLKIRERLRNGPLK